MSIRKIIAVSVLCLTGSVAMSAPTEANFYCYIGGELKSTTKIKLESPRYYSTGYLGTSFYILSNKDKLIADELFLSCTRLANLDKLHDSHKAISHDELEKGQGDRAVELRMGEKDYVTFKAQYGLPIGHMNDDESSAIRDYYDAALPGSVSSMLYSYFIENATKINARKNAGLGDAVVYKWKNYLNGIALFNRSTTTSKCPTDIRSHLNVLQKQGNGQAEFPVGNQIIKILPSDVFFDSSIEDHENYGKLVEEKYKASLKEEITYTVLMPFYTFGHVSLSVLNIHHGKLTFQVIDSLVSQAKDKEIAVKMEDIINGFKDKFGDEHVTGLEIKHMGIQLPFQTDCTRYVIAWAAAMAAGVDLDKLNGTDYEKIINEMLTKQGQSKSLYLI
ncbi:hypothetical protein [Cysteiniphilum sp. JM-1]|uniref:hypothetical protein n=1 Tax=Cysteiniphilum sp. JM-1 TaxID=2610891 RepID=UPI0012472637|nr:hypothetical protein [Cysteiniphilum sp. JM-1]